MISFILIFNIYCGVSNFICYIFEHFYFNFSHLGYLTVKCHWAKRASSSILLSLHSTCQSFVSRLLHWHWKDNDNIKIGSQKLVLRRLTVILMWRPWWNLNTNYFLLNPTVWNELTFDLKIEWIKENVSLPIRLALSSVIMITSEVCYFVSCPQKYKLTIKRICTTCQLFSV